MAKTRKYSTRTSSDSGKGSAHVWHDGSGNLDFTSSEFTIDSANMTVLGADVDIEITQVIAGVTYWVYVGGQWAGGAPTGAGWFSYEATATDTASTIIDALVALINADFTGTPAANDTTTATSTTVLRITNAGGSNGDYTLVMTGAGDTSSTYRYDHDGVIALNTDDTSPMGVRVGNAVFAVLATDETVDLTKAAAVVLFDKTAASDWGVRAGGALMVDDGTDTVTITPVNDTGVEIYDNADTTITMHAQFNDGTGAQHLFVHSNSRTAIYIETLSAVACRVNYGGAASVTSGAEYGKIISDGTSVDFTFEDDKPPNGAINIAAASAVQLIVEVDYAQ
jgi:hypothetical protein